MLYELNYSLFMMNWYQALIAGEPGYSFVMWLGKIIQGGQITGFGIYEDVVQLRWYNHLLDSKIWLPNTIFSFLFVQPF